MVMQKHGLGELCNAWHFDPRLGWTYASDGLYAVDTACVADVDNTLTGRPTLTDIWREEVAKDSGIRPLVPKINYGLKFLAENPYSVKQAFDYIFVDTLGGVLRKDVNMDACVEAAYRTPPLANTADLVFDLRDRGVLTAVLTYGIHDALVPWYDIKVGVPVHTLAGTKLIFHNGLLAGYDMGGAYGKASRAESILRSAGVFRGHTVAISDDPVIDSVMAAMIGTGLMVWVDGDGRRRELAASGQFEYPGKNVIVLRGVDEDRLRIIECIGKKQRADFIAETVPPSRILALRQEFDRMGAAIDACKRSEYDREAMMEEAVESCGRVIALGNPFVATVTNGVEETFNALRIGLYVDGDWKEMMQWTDELRTTLKRENPELTMPDEYLDGIRMFI